MLGLRPRAVDSCPSQAKGGKATEMSATAVCNFAYAYAPSEAK